MNNDYDFIGVYDDVVPVDYCNAIINLFNHADSLGFTKSRWEDSGFDGATKEDISLFANQIPATHLFNADQYKPFQDALWAAYAEYSKKYHVAMKVTDEHSLYTIKMQKTLPGQGYHIWHYEASSRENSNRFMTFTLYLNDVEEGGETEFLYQHRRVSPKAGRLVFFPACVTHVHRGNPPLSGEKYILTGWLDF